ATIAARRGGPDQRLAVRPLLFEPDRLIRSLGRREQEGALAILRDREPQVGLRGGRTAVLRRGDGGPGAERIGEARPWDRGRGRDRRGRGHDRRGRERRG